MREAVSKLSPAPDAALCDAVTIPGLSDRIRQVPIIKGDAKSLSIAAASIVAKVTRDRMMREYDRLYPEYGFAAHKGYGSAEHMAASANMNDAHSQEELSEKVSGRGVIRSVEPAQDRHGIRRAGGRKAESSRL